MCRQYVALEVTNRRLRKCQSRCGYALRPGSSLSRAKTECGAKGWSKGRETPRPSQSLSAEIATRLCHASRLRRGANIDRLQHLVRIPYGARGQGF